MPAQATPRSVATALVNAESVLGAATVLPSWVAASERWRGDADLAFGTGNAARSAGRPRVALEAYRQALALDPQHVPARNNLADLLLSLGCTDAARETLAPAFESLSPGESLWQAVKATSDDIDAAGRANCSL